MPRYTFVTLDVFTTRRFGGNPLAVFPDARGLSDAQMQALAREFNYSETTFVLPPNDPANTARVRIFTPGYEMAFAGHPNVGTAAVLAEQGRDVGGRMRFEEIAGLVEIEVARDADGRVTSATLQAPQPLTVGEPIDPAVFAACAGLAPGDILADPHPPCRAGMGTGFIFAEVPPEALGRAAPSATAMARADAALKLGGQLGLHLYARDPQDPSRLRTRMFAALGSALEDPATGSANVALAGLLLSRCTLDEVRYEISQGVEMGRPSTLHAHAWRARDGIRARIGGACVTVLRGEAELED